MKFLKTTTALALIFGMTADIYAQSSNVSSQPPVQPADSNTNLDVTPTGTPIVNIAAPDQNGTSYNRFTRFNVNREGLIINNSKVIGQTVLGGLTLANPNLRDSSNANLILAEVVSSNRSDLFGPIELFGPQATFILANEAGITCDGCGFINIGRVALSTGKITFGANGEFTGFATSQGSVRIAGDGLLAGNVDFFDIVTSSAEINASLFARDLVIAGGNGQYDFTSRTSTASGDSTPRIVIDSSSLGGMFANRIRLIGTGDGVGINLRGAVTSLEGALEITSDGEISVSSVIASGDIVLDSSSGSINIDERLYGAGNVSINADEDINNNGDFLAAGNDINIISGGNISFNSDGVFAGLSTEGVLDQAGSIVINATGEIAFNDVQVAASEQNLISGDAISISEGSAVSGSDLSLLAIEDINVDGITQSQDALNITANVIDITGNVVGNGELQLTANELTITGDAIGITGADIDISDQLSIGIEGSIQTNGTLEITTNTIDNQGQILGVNEATITAIGNVNNDGEFLTNGNLTLETSGNIHSTGVISANGSASIQTDSDAQISGIIASADDLLVSANNLDISGQLSTSGVLNISSLGNINAGDGAILVADGNLDVSAGENLSIDAQISTGTTAILTAGNDINISGQLFANDDITLKAINIRSDSEIVTNAGLSIAADEAINLTGTLSANEALTVTADSINLSEAARAVANNSIRLLVSNNITNAGALSGQEVTIHARDINNSGSLFSSSDLSIEALETITQTGIAESIGALVISGNNIALDGRSVGIDGVDINAAQITFSDQNDIQSGNALSIVSVDDLTLRGSIVSVGTANIIVEGNLTQQANIDLGADGVLTASGAFDNIGNISAAASIALTGSEVNIDGNISANGVVDLIASDNIASINGVISAAGTINVEALDTLTVNGSLISNDEIALHTGNLQLGGIINATRGLDTSLIRSLSIDETASLLSGNILSLELDDFENLGLIFGNDGVDITVTTDFANLGQIISEQNLIITTAGDFSNEGLLQSGADLSINANGQQLLNGTIVANNDLQFAATNLNILGTS